MSSRAVRYLSLIHILPVDPRERLSLWREEVSVEKNAELGMLRVIVKNDSQREAERVSKGIASVLIEKNNLFRGGEELSLIHI